MFTETTMETAGTGSWPSDDEGDSLDFAPSITGSEWVALLKVASCDWTIELCDLACLLERRLIEKRDGVMTLTERGRVALGIPV